MTSKSKRERIDAEKRAVGWRRSSRVGRVVAWWEERWWHRNGGLRFYAAVLALVVAVAGVKALIG
jgi:hypothetical protein